MLFIIADDHPLFRDALRAIVAAAYSSAQLLQVGEVGALYAAVEQHRDADLLLLDLTMPGVHGYSALIHLRALYPALPIMVVSGRFDTLTIRRALAHGAMGFVPKSADAETIAGAIAQVLRGDLYDPLVEAGGSILSSAEQAAAERIRGLTPAQFRILAGMCEGKLNKQIAYELGITEATVKAHVTQVLRKIGANNRTQAVTLAADLALDPERARLVDIDG
jgi:DNA-binding NarL/FixJ family response regulator